MGRRVQPALRSGTRRLRHPGADATRVLRLVPRPDRAVPAVSAAERAAATPTTTVPAALAEPTEPVRGRWVALLVLAQLGVWMAFFTPIQVLLPQQIEAIDQAHKETMLGWVTGFGAAAAMVVNPLAGALSDRTSLRFAGRALGRRH